MCKEQKPEKPLSGGFRSSFSELAADLIFKVRVQNAEYILAHVRESEQLSSVLLDLLLTEAH